VLLLLLSAPLRPNTPEQPTHLRRPAQRGRPLRMMYEPWTRSSAAYGSFTHEPLNGYRSNPFAQTAPSGCPVSNEQRRQYSFVLDQTRA